MNGLAAECRCWSGRRWWTVILLTFAAQVGLIFALSDRAIHGPKPGRAAPQMQFDEHLAAEVRAITDPTLFALPHPEGFSGPAWLTLPKHEFHSYEWSEPPRWLEVARASLGAGFAELVATNQAENYGGKIVAQPFPALPALVMAPTAPEHSTLRIVGDLAQRRLLVPLSLPSWPSPDLLGSTEVQLLVDAEGRPRSAVVVSKCGNGLADDYALNQAWAARFNSIAREGPTRPSEGALEGLSRGWLIFDWLTVPVPGTNVPSADIPGN